MFFKQFCKHFSKLLSFSETIYHCFVGFSKCNHHSGFCEHSSYNVDVAEDEVEVDDVDDVDDVEDVEDVEDDGVKGEEDDDVEEEEDGDVEDADDVEGEDRSQDREPFTCKMPPTKTGDHTACEPAMRIYQD